jgi:GntR family transcriptional regulator
MFIKISFTSGIPTYLQIVEQVKYAAASGSLRPGDALPSIRILAEQLRINRNTVAKAYAELEHQGVIEIVQGKGAFLSSQVSPFNGRIQASVLNEAIDSVIVQAHHFQISRERLLERIHQRLDEFEKKNR